MKAILVLFGLILAVLALAVFGARYLFDYRLSERGLYVVVLRWVPVKVLSLRRIAAVQRGPFDESFWRWGAFTNVRLGNRPGGEVVLVKTRGLPITGVVVTPADPDAFEQDLRRLLESRGVT